MNNLQVAKVAHEATRALGETTGDSGSSQVKWEQLSDQQRQDKTDEIAAHISRHKKGVNVDDVAQPLAETEKLKHYITAGVADAFLRHHAALEKGSEQAVRERAYPKHLADARDEYTRKDPHADPKNVAEAMAKSDADIAKANQPQQQPYHADAVPPIEPRRGSSTGSTETDETR